MKIFNYSKLRKNENKIYNIGGYSIPGGLDVTVFASAILTTAIMNIIGYPIIKALGFKYFDFSSGNYFLGFFMIFFPLVGGGSLAKIKIQNTTIFRYAMSAVKYIFKKKNSSLIGEKGNNKKEHIYFKIEDPL